MFAHGVRVAVLIALIVSALLGCASEGTNRDVAVKMAAKELSPTERLEATTAVERHLEALGANDVDAILETVTDVNRSVYRNNLEQLERWRGFEPESIAQGGRFIQLGELEQQYEGLGFSRITVFNVIGRFPEPRLDEVLPEDFDLVVVRDASGRWLVHDSGH